MYDNEMRVVVIRQEVFYVCVQGCLNDGVRVFVCYKLIIEEVQL